MRGGAVEVKSARKIAAKRRVHKPSAAEASDGQTRSEGPESALLIESNGGETACRAASSCSSNGEVPRMGPVPLARRGAVLETGDFLCFPTESELAMLDRSRLPINFVFPVDTAGEDVRTSHKNRAFLGSPSRSGPRFSSGAPPKVSEEETPFGGQEPPLTGSRASRASSGPHAMTGSTSRTSNRTSTQQVRGKIGKKKHHGFDAVEVGPVPRRSEIGDDDAPQNNRHNGMSSPRSSIADPGSTLIDNGDEADATLQAALAVAAAAVAKRQEEERAELDSGRASRKAVQPTTPTPFLSARPTPAMLDLHRGIGKPSSIQRAAAARQEQEAAVVAIAASEVACNLLLEDPPVLPSTADIMNLATIPLAGVTAAGGGPAAEDELDVFQRTLTMSVDMISKIAAAKREGVPLASLQDPPRSAPAKSPKKKRGSSDASETAASSAASPTSSSTRRASSRVATTEPPTEETAKMSSSAVLGISPEELSAVLKRFDASKLHHHKIQRSTANHYSPSPDAAEQARVRDSLGLSERLADEWKEFAVKCLYANSATLRKAPETQRRMSLRHYPATELVSEFTAEEQAERSCRDSLIADLQRETCVCLPKPTEIGKSTCPLISIVADRCVVEPLRGLHWFVWKSYNRAKLAYSLFSRLSKVLLLEHYSADVLRTLTMALYEIDGCIVTVVALPDLVADWMQEIVAVPLGNLRHGDTSFLGHLCAQVVWHLSLPARLFDVYSNAQRVVNLAKGQDGGLYILDPMKLHDRSGDDGPMQDQPAGSQSGKPSSSPSKKKREKKGRPSNDAADNLDSSSPPSLVMSPASNPEFGKFSAMKRGAVMSVGGPTGVSSPRHNVAVSLSGARRGSVSAAGSSEANVVLSTMLFRPQWLFQPLHEQFQLFCLSSLDAESRNALVGDAFAQAVAFVDYITCTVVPLACEELVKEAHAALAALEEHFVLQHANKDEKLEHAILHMVRSGALSRILHKHHLPVAAAVLVLRCCNEGNFGASSGEAGSNPTSPRGDGESNAAIQPHHRRTLEDRRFCDDDDGDPKEEGAAASEEAHIGRLRLPKTVAVKHAQDTAARKVVMRTIKAEMLGRSCKQLLRLCLTTQGGPVGDHMHVRIVNRLQGFLVEPHSNADSRLFWDQQLLPLARRKFRLFQGSKDLLFADHKMIPTAAITHCMLLVHPFCTTDVARTVPTVDILPVLPVPTVKKSKAKSAPPTAAQLEEALTNRLGFSVRADGISMLFTHVLLRKPVTLHIVAHLPYSLTRAAGATCFASSRGSVEALRGSPESYDAPMSRLCELIRVQRVGSIGHSASWVRTWVTAMRLQHTKTLAALEQIWTTSEKHYKDSVAQMRSDAVDRLSAGADSASGTTTVVLTGNRHAFAKLEAAQRGNVDGGPKCTFLSTMLSNTQATSTSHVVVAAKSASNEPKSEEMFGVKAAQEVFAHAQVNLLHLLLHYRQETLVAIARDLDKIRFGGLELNENNLSIVVVVHYVFLIVRAISRHSLVELANMNNGKGSPDDVVLAVTPAANSAAVNASPQVVASAARLPIPPAATSKPEMPSTRGGLAPKSLTINPSKRNSFSPPSPLSKAGSDTFTTTAAEDEAATASQVPIMDGAHAAEFARDENIIRWLILGFNILVTTVLKQKKDVTDHHGLVLAMSAAGDSMPSRNSLQCIELLRFLEEKFDTTARSSTPKDMSDKVAIQLRTVACFGKHGKLLTQPQFLELAVSLLDMCIFLTYRSTTGVADFESDNSLRALLTVVLIGCAKVQDAPRVACVRRLLHRVESDERSVLSSLQVHLQEESVLGNTYWLFRQSAALDLLAKVKLEMDARNADSSARQRLQTFLEFHKKQLVCVKKLQAAGRGALSRRATAIPWIDFDRQRTEAREAAALLLQQEEKLRLFEAREAEAEVARKAREKELKRERRRELDHHLQEVADEIAAAAERFKAKTAAEQQLSLLISAGHHSSTSTSFVRSRATSLFSGFAAPAPIVSGAAPRDPSKKKTKKHRNPVQLREESVLDETESAASAPEKEAACLRRHRSEPLYQVPKPPQDRKPNFISSFTRPSPPRLGQLSVQDVMCHDGLNELLRRIFMFCDADKDGFVTADEVILATDELELTFFVRELRSIFGTTEFRYVKHRKGCTMTFDQFRDVVMEGCGLV